MGKVNGVALGTISAGGLFLFAGIKGISVTGAIQDIVSGKSPVNAIANQWSAATAPGIPGSAPGEVPGAGSPPASGPAQPAGGSAGQYQAYAFSLFPQYGWGADQQSPLISLWNGESGWDPTAYNPGTHTTNPDDHHAFGIPQALPASKMASAGSDWRTNGYTQIRWGLGYIHDVYGSPSNAYGKWLGRQPHWY